MLIPLLATFLALPPSTERLLVRSARHPLQRAFGCSWSGYSVYPTFSVRSAEPGEAE